MAIVYLLMGVLFTYIAIQSAQNTGWSFTTILLTLIATLDFGVGIRLMKMYLFPKRNK
ncbi:YdiK family protein [Virgibacillus sp. W0430]|uniref:YdiK family protein n=1 Tax=Virgibacillus sp. W0430 TaxID=3391580 RepID=UPI003F487420